jgi:soluble lytic murein transglycosylase-like protein
VATCGTPVALAAALLLRVVFRLICFVTAFAALTDGAAAQRVSAQPDGATCTLNELPGLSAQYSRARRADAARGRADAADGALTPGQASDFWTVALSVLRVNKRNAPATASGRAPVDGVGLPSLASLPCDATVRARDGVAWSMGIVGYSAREIADVIDGHLTRSALDQAYMRSMAGAPRHEVIAFLESRWRTQESSARRGPTPSCAHPGGASRASPDTFASEIASLAQQHRVAPALIRAVIAAESGGNPCAVSRAGAIGLMQLMPATAAALGVDPWNPLDNLRGGIAYLASMLRAYAEDTRLALIAYNAGPQHADRVRAGQAVAYQETRRYLDAINAFLQRSGSSQRQR